MCGADHGIASIAPMKARLTSQPITHLLTADASNLKASCLILRARLYSAPAHMAFLAWDDQNTVWDDQWQSPENDQAATNLFLKRLSLRFNPRK